MNAKQAAESGSPENLPNGLQTCKGLPVSPEVAARAVAARGLTARAASTLIKLKTGVTVVWGIPTAQKQASLGVVQSVRRSPTGKEKTYPGEDGDTAAVIYYDHGLSLTIEIICASTASVPDRGDVLTHDSQTFLVENCEENWQAEDVQKITVTAKAWDNIALA